MEYGTIMVTVRCATYNHVDYIRQCLDGFVMQKTNFRFEAIVHDDASTDGTADIVREYASKYPDIIKPIYETENQYSKKDGSIRRIFNQHTRGKYIAMCEGDDYWTDPLKLQKQVDFLESHPDYVMCSHRYDEYIQDLGTLNTCTVHKDVDYDLNTLINGGWLFQTLSVMYLVSAFDENHYKQYGTSIDTVANYELLRTGKKGRCLGQVMGVYRHHSKGVWIGIPNEIKWDWEFDVRLKIYAVEKNKDAAQFLLMQFTRPLSRKWMLKRIKIFFKVFQILVKHFGFLYPTSVLLNKLIFSKRL